MPTITLDSKWIESAKLFGDVKIVVQDAIRNYSIEQCKTRINEAVSNKRNYAQKYGCDYNRFKNSIQTDENFLGKLEKINPLWEEDAME